jgi:hypothetical protein
MSRAKSRKNIAPMGAKTRAETNGSLNMIPIAEGNQMLPTKAPNTPITRREIKLLPLAANAAMPPINNPITAIKIIIWDAGDIAPTPLRRNRRSASFQQF